MMKRNLKSLLAATGLGLALASPFAMAQPASPFPNANDDPSIAAPSASQGSQGERGRPGMSRGEGRHGKHGHHASRHGGDAMSQADRQARRAAMDKLATPEERTAFREKMRSATPEQRPQLMAARRAEMEQRAKDRGVTLPVMQHGGERSGQRGSERRGHRHGPHGSGAAAPVPGPATPAQPAAPASM
ncbi:MAG: hypothetical protein K2W80_15485 [Burkholderiales bacterium]|nr:hypothetical protein [Burkholderiales bacterium]